MTDKEYFCECIRQCENGMYKLAMGILKNETDAEDAMQDAKFCGREWERKSHIFRAIGRCQAQIKGAQGSGRPSIGVAQGKDVFA